MFWTWWAQLLEAARFDGIEKLLYCAYLTLGCLWLCLSSVYFVYIVDILFIFELAFLHALDVATRMSVITSPSFEIIRLRSTSF